MRQTALSEPTRALCGCHRSSTQGVILYGTGLRHSLHPDTGTQGVSKASLLHTRESRRHCPIHSLLTIRASIEVGS